MKITVDGKKIIKSVKKLDGIEIVLENQEDAKEAVNLILARSGMLEQASGGTLLLDEIGDLSMPSQVKLLRLFQDGEFLPLGSDVAKRSDTRILVATNQDLDECKNSGKFRKDLYYRLCDHHIHIPPLRDRKEDLPLLLEHFLDKAAETLGKHYLGDAECLRTCFHGYIKTLKLSTVLNILNIL